MISMNFFLNIKLGSDLLLVAAGEKVLVLFLYCALEEVYYICCTMFK